MSSSHPTYTLGFSHGGMRDSLTHFVHLKRDLKLLWVFDSLTSQLARMSLFFLFSSNLELQHSKKMWGQVVVGLWSGERQTVKQQEETCVLVKFRHTLNCGKKSLNSPRNFVSFVRLQAWIHIIELVKNTLDVDSSVISFNVLRCKRTLFVYY